MLGLYSFLLLIVSPFLRLYLWRRTQRGKENKARVAERYGIASQARPNGKLIWCHAASVGEVMTLIPLIEKIKADRLQVLVTTGTVTSARLIQNRLGNQIIHQFVPLDVPVWVQCFMKHWRPDVALFVESELWPNLLKAAKQCGTECVLLNARLSQKTFAKWQIFSWIAKSILQNFDLILTQSDTDTGRYTKLGAVNVHTVGNLKFAMEKLSFDLIAAQKFKDSIHNRPVWLLASSHDGEDQIALETHYALKRHFLNILTVIVPRHLERSDAITKLLQFSNLNFTRRSENELPTANTEIYLADTMGEMGIFFDAIKIVCIGGSLVPKGGHNMIEAARFGCALLYGPYMTSSPSIRMAFEKDGAGQMVRNSTELAEAVKNLLQNAVSRDSKSELAQKVAMQNQNVLDLTISYLHPIFSRSQFR